MGAVIAAFISTPIGILTEVTIAEVWVTNPGLKAQFEEATIGRYIRETLRNMLGAAAGAYLAKWLGSLTPQEMDSALVAVLKKLGSKIAIPADFGAYVLVKKWVVTFPNISVLTCAYYRVIDELNGLTKNVGWDEVIKKVGENLSEDDKRIKL